MNEFQDPELERMLGRASGAYPDANVAFEAVRGRVRQVKRRRAMVASTAACVLLAGVVALAVRGGDDGQVQPAVRRDPSPSVEVVDTTPDTEANVSVPETEVTPDTTIADGTMTSVGTDSGSPGGPGTNAGKGNAGKGSKATTTTTATATSVAPQVQPTTPAVAVTTFSSKGGTVSVQLVNGRMVLVGTSPVAGFTAHLNEVSGDRIRIEFTDGNSSYEVQLELSNGHITNSSQNKGP